jgi:hypothetical protein
MIVMRIAMTSLSETEAVVFMPHRPYNQAFDHPKVRRIQQLEELFEYLADK